MVTVPIDCTRTANSDHQTNTFTLTNKLPFVAKAFATRAVLHDIQCRPSQPGCPENITLLSAFQDLIQQLSSDLHLLPQKVGFIMM